MKYFTIDLMPRKDPQLCFLHKVPEGIGLERFKFRKGVAFAGSQALPFKMFMSKEEPGTRLASLVGNTCRMLIVHRDVQQAIADTNEGETEYLPLEIYDHRKKLASSEHFVVNPLGQWDCLDLEASSIEYLKGKVVGVDEMVLDPKKLERTPDLFRVREAPFEYVITSKLMNAIQKAQPKLSNFDTKPLRVARE